MPPSGRYDLLQLDAEVNERLSNIEKTLQTRTPSLNRHQLKFRPPPQRKLRVHKRNDIEEEEERKRQIAASIPEPEQTPPPPDSRSISAYSSGNKTHIKTIKNDSQKTVLQSVKPFSR